MATFSPVSVFLANFTLAKLPSPSVLPNSYFPTRVLLAPPVREAMSFPSIFAQPKIQFSFPSLPQYNLKISSYFRFFLSRFGDYLLTIKTSSFCTAAIPATSLPSSLLLLFFKRKRFINYSDANYEISGDPLQNSKTQTSTIQDESMRDCDRQIRHGPHGIE